MEKITFKNLKQQKVFDAILEFRSTLNFSMLKTSLRKKDIKINGKKITDNIVINSGDIIEMYLKDKKQKTIPIIFEDDNILLAFKPQGMETTKKDKTFAQSDCMEDVINFGACHRLDKNTEGIVVFAKNKISENILLQGFKNHDIKKIYSAVVFGKINKNGEKFVDFLVKNNNIVKIFDNHQQNSQIAKLSYIVKKQIDELFEIEVDLETGRTHQIRAQLSHHGIFVLGDEKYGEKFINKKYHKTKQVLCAKKIIFENLSKPLDYLNGKVFEVLPTFDIELIGKNYK